MDQLGCLQHAYTQYKYILYIIHTYMYILMLIGKKNDPIPLVSPCCNDSPKQNIHTPLP